MAAVLTALLAWLRAARDRVTAAGCTAVRLSRPARGGHGVRRRNLLTPAAPPPVRQPAAAPTVPVARPAPSPAPTGEGAPPAAPRGWPRPDPGSHPYPATGFSAAPLYDELIAVTDGTGPRAVIWPQAPPSLRETGRLAALDAAPLPREWDTSLPVMRALLAGLRAL